MSFLKKLAISFLLCVGGGWLSGLVTRQGIKDWYNHLILPIGTPPNIVFPIVWTILYSMMAISLTLLWSSPSRNKKIPVLLFVIQLVLNFFWSWLFFGLRNPGIALLDLLFLWLCLVATIVTFWKHTRLGASLLLPYLGWITYAFYLNFYIWRYNS